MNSQVNNNERSFVYGSRAGNNAGETLPKLAEIWLKDLITD